VVGLNAKSSVYGFVRVLDGRSGALLFDLLPGTGSSDVTPLQRIGDVDGDGLDDVFTVEHAVGKQIFGVHSSATRLRIWSHVSWGNMWVVDDLDRDGVHDVALGIWLNYPQVSPIEIRSGASGALLATIQPPSQAEPSFGATMASIDDIDGDGLDDLLVGDLYRGTSNEGAAEIFSLGTGAVLASFSGVPWSNFGLVNAFDDVDQDGRRDFLIGASYERNASGYGTGVIRFYSSATLAEVLRFEMADGTGLHAIHFPGDIDGDGLDELGITAHYDPPAVPERPVSIWSLRTGVRLRGIDSITDMVSVPDQDGDGDDEIAWYSDYAIGDVKLERSGWLVLERSGPAWLTATPRVRELDYGGETGELGTPPPPIPGTGGALSALTRFHVAGFKPGTTVTLKLVDFDGVTVDRVVRRDIVRADGTAELPFVRLHTRTASALGFVASGTLPSGAPFTTGRETVEWRD
jgi:hypothetical protein